MPVPFAPEKTGRLSVRVLSGGWKDCAVLGLIIGLPGIGDQLLNTDVFNGLLLLSAQFVRIATNDMLVNTNGTVFVSVHRVQIATGTTPGSGCTSCFVSAHRLQIATGS